MDSSSARSSLERKPSLFSGSTYLSNKTPSIPYTATSTSVAPRRVSSPAKSPSDWTAGSSMDAGMTLIRASVAASGGNGASEASRRMNPNRTARMPPWTPLLNPGDGLSSLDRETNQVANPMQANRIIESSRLVRISGYCLGAVAGVEVIFDLDIMPKASRISPIIMTTAPT